MPVYSLFQRGLGVIGGQWYSPPSFAVFIVFVYHTCMILYIIQPYPGIICQVPGYVLLEYPRVLFFVDFKQVFFLAYRPKHVPGYPEYYTTDLVEPHVICTDYGGSRRIENGSECG